MPSPLTFKIAQAGAPVTVNGYCRSRKDSLAMYKGDDGSWQVIHKASGNSVSTALSTSVTGYPKTMALMQHVQEEAAESLAILDRLDLGEKPRSPDMTTAAAELFSVIKSFKG